MEQVVKFNQADGGHTLNFCLANVCAGFGIPNKYGSAWEAWEHTQQHTDPIPDGLDVPVFFSYEAIIDGVNKNWGHIGVRLSDGQFWSDGNLYPSIEAYEANHTPRYVGWGESINDVTILGGHMIDDSNVDLFWLLGVGRHPSPDERPRYIGWQWDKAAADILQNSYRTGVVDVAIREYPNALTKITDLQNQLKAKQEQSQPQASVPASYNPLPDSPAPSPVPPKSPPTPISRPKPSGQGSVQKANRLRRLWRWLMTLRWPF